MFTYQWNRLLAKKHIALFCIVTMIFAGCSSCWHPANRQPNPTYKDPHHHIVDINQHSLPQDMIEKYHIIEVAMDPDVLRENVTPNQDGSFIAFTTWEDVSRIYVEDTENGIIMEIQKFLEWRPFSDLTWLEDGILVFDQWSNPHYGIHYVVDIRNKTVLIAAPFPDELPTLTPTPELASQ